MTRDVDPLIGRTFDVLFEKPGRHPGQIVGRSPYLQSVQVTAGASWIGKVPEDLSRPMAPQTNRLICKVHF